MLSIWCNCPSWQCLRPSFASNTKDILELSFHLQKWGGGGVGVAYGLHQAARSGKTLLRVDSQCNFLIRLACWTFNINPVSVLLIRQICIFVIGRVGREDNTHLKPLHLKQFCSGWPVQRQQWKCKGCSQVSNKLQTSEIAAYLIHRSLVKKKAFLLNPEVKDVRLHFLVWKRHILGPSFVPSIFL